MAEPDAATRPTAQLERASGRKVSQVDPAEVPSAQWGWSGESPKVFHAFGVVVIVLLLGMLIGNHKGHIEDIYLVGFAALIAALIVRDVLVRRRPR